MTHLKEILIDFKRCFIPGDFAVERYGEEYVMKAEAHSLNAASQAELQKVADLLKNDAPKLVLDVGCNSGRPLDFICDKLGSQGVGIDVNSAAVSKAQSDYPDREFHHYDGDHIPLENNRFDHVMIHHVLGHVRDPILTLKEIRRVLKPGGTLSIVTPNTYFKIWQFPFNIINNFGPDVSVLRYFENTELKKILEQLNFKTEELSNFGAAPSYCPPFLKNKFLLRAFVLTRKT